MNARHSWMKIVPEQKSSCAFFLERAAVQKGRIVHMRIALKRSVLKYRTKPCKPPGRPLQTVIAICRIDTEIVVYRLVSTSAPNFVCTILAEPVKPDTDDEH